MYLVLVGCTVAAGVAVWFGVYAGVLALTRSPKVRPAASTPDLGDEPPAVAGLLAGGWRTPADAGQATLLDLAGRGLIELRQPGRDATQTTVHVNQSGSRDGLTAYERMVLDRVEGVARTGPAPVSALTFRDEGAARSWHRRIQAEVVADARRRGLSRRRFGAWAITVLAVTGIAIGIGIAAVAVVTAPADDEGDTAKFGMIVGLALAAYGLRYPGERDTPAGRARAAHWLGVRQWIQAQPALAYQPPAAAAYSNGYLPYAAALGTARLAGAVLDLGMGSRNSVWSRHGGQWHRVRVSYPTNYRRYGRTVWQLASQAVLRLAAGIALVVFYDRPRGWLAAVSPRLQTDVFDLLEPAFVVVGVALLASGAYLLVRTLLDVTMRRTVTGEIVWIESWRADDGERRSYLAIDDGQGERTKAWVIAEADVRPYHHGDTVRALVRPWSRRVQRLQMVQRGRRPAEVADEKDMDQLMTTLVRDRVAAAATRSRTWIERVADVLGG
ncbi:MAG: DUF2207 domain-containing protein [Hamadaea sp.]|nr:DUF2207 domain-containing protein [Hamadaea sp.]